MQKTEFVESYFAAWNHCDAKGVADHLTTDPGNRDSIEEVVARYEPGLVTRLLAIFRKQCREPFARRLFGRLSALNRVRFTAH